MMVECNVSSAASLRKSWLVLSNVAGTRELDHPVPFFFCVCNGEESIPSLTGRRTFRTIYESK
jgi:hypothetical protein